MKKVLNYLFVAVIAVISMISVVNAETSINGTDGVITISAKKGEDYKIFRILDLESFDSDKGLYSYKVNSKWETFIKGSSYVTVSGNYVTGLTKENAPEFAKLAYNYASGIANDGEKTATEDGPITFSNLPLGYYLVSSSIGVVCSLNTTNKVANITEKNATPVIDKFMGDEAAPLVENSATIGQVIPYTITLTNVKGVKNVKITDTLSDGLTYNKDIEVKVDGEILSTNNYGLVISDDKKVITFTLENDYTKSLTSNVDITITYTATVNENSETNVANKNTAVLTYGNKRSQTSETNTYTYSFSFSKVDGENKPLDGAEFELYTSLEKGTKIPVVRVGYDEETSTSYYRVAVESEEADVIVAGNVVVEGLATGTYYLEETKQPAGYNLLAARVPVLVNERKADGRYEVSYKTIANTSGTVLPTTGGVGTKLFVSIGSLLVIGFGITLITKFRLKKEI